MQHVRIVWEEIETETRAWNELPTYMKQGLPRDPFVRDLLDRRQSYLRTIERTLAEQGVFGDFVVRQSGDWHDGKCVLVVESAEVGRLVIKPRSNEVTSLVRSICIDSRITSLHSTHVPTVKNVGDLWLQDYYGPAPAELSGGTLGGLLAITVWTGLVDLHSENLVFANDSVALVDVECAFCVSDVRTAMGQLEISGLVNGKEPGLPAISMGPLDIKVACSAFRSALASLAGSSNELYDAMDTTRLRRVLIKTGLYMTFLRQRFTFGWTADEASARWKHLRSANPAPDALVQYETESLLTWSVPLFYQLGPDILTGRAEKVDQAEVASVAMRQLHRNISEEKDLDAFVGVALGSLSAY